MQTKTDHYGVILPLLILIGKYFAILSLLTLLAACAPMQTATSVPDFAAGNSHDHGTLARRYEKLAEEMQAKVQAQKKIFKQKTYSSHFGKNRKSTRSRITNKIRKYQQAAKEYSAKAAYHKGIAAKQAIHKSAASKNSIDKSLQIDKTH